MLESIGQYGPGYRSPSYHEIRNPLLDRAVNKTEELRKKHEDAWKEYGCTIMSDGWTDTSHHHLINFLANSLARTFFLGLVDASSEIANASMLADLLEKQIDKVGKGMWCKLSQIMDQTTRLLEEFLWRGSQLCFGHHVLPIVWI